MFIIYINDVPTDISFADMQEAIRWVESTTRSYPNGFSLTEWYDPDSNRIYNIVEKDKTH